MNSQKSLVDSEIKETQTTPKRVNLNLKNYQNSRNHIDVLSQRQDSQPLIAEQTNESYEQTTENLDKKHYDQILEKALLSESTMKFI